MDLSQIENELNVQPTPHGGAPISAPARNNKTLAAFLPAFFFTAIFVSGAYVWV